MHFNTNALRDAVTKAKAFIARNGALPVLRGIRVEQIAPNRAAISATDLEAGAFLTVEIDGGTFEPVVVDGKQLLDALRRKDNYATCNLDSDGIFGAGPNTVGLKTYPVDDWPNIALPKAGEGLVKLGGDVGGLIEALPRVAIAASTDQARPILCGVAVEYDPDRGQIDLVTTDSYKLAAYQTEVNAFIGKVIWPAKAVTNIARSLGPDVAIHIGERETWFASPGRLFYARHTEGAFPKWRSLFPTGEPTWTWNFNSIDEHQKMVTVDKMFKGHIPVVFNAADGTEKATQADEASFSGKMSGSWEEGDFKFALNPGYLAACIRIADQTGTNGVTLSAIDSLKPMILTGEPGWKVLQMPVRV